MPSLKELNRRAGTTDPEDWERHNIEDAIKGWQQAYG